MKRVFLPLLFIVSSFISSQEAGNLTSVDKDFLDSLPDSVRSDVMAEMDSNKEDKKNLQRRPSTSISKLETVKNWENYKNNWLIKIFNNFLNR